MAVKYGEMKQFRLATRTINNQSVNVAEQIALLPLTRLSSSSSTKVAKVATTSEIDSLLALLGG